MLGMVEGDQRREDAKMVWRRNRLARLYTARGCPTSIKIHVHEKIKKNNPLMGYSPYEPQIVINECMNEWMNVF